MKKKTKRSRNLTSRVAGATILVLVLVVSAFGAGVLMAKEKENPASPRARYLVPEGCTVESIQIPSVSRVQIRVKDAAGDIHVFLYEQDKGNRKIAYHVVIAKVPEAQAFEE